MRATAFGLATVVLTTSTDLLGQEPIKPYWLEVVSARRLPQTQAYRLSVVKEFGLDKQLNRMAMDPLKTPDEFIPGETADFEPVFGSAYWYLGDGKYQYNSFYAVPGLEEFNKRVQYHVDRMQGAAKPIVTRKETEDKRTDVTIVVPKPEGVTSGWLDLHMSYQDGVVIQGSNTISKAIVPRTIKPWLPQLTGKQPFVAIDFDQIEKDKMSWLTSGLFQRASTNLGLRDGAVIEHIVNTFLGKNGEAEWLKDAKTLVMWTDWPIKESEKFKVEATFKFQPDSNTSKFLQTLGQNARSLSLGDKALASGSFSFHVPKENTAFLTQLIADSPLLGDSTLAQKLKGTLEAGVLEGALHVGQDKSMPARFAMRYAGEPIDHDDIREVRDNTLAPDEVTDRSGSPLEEALNLLTETKTKVAEGFFMAASSEELLRQTEPPQASPGKNRLIDIKVDLSPLLVDSRIEQTRTTFQEIEDWWDFFTFDNRIWWGFRTSKNRLTGNSSMNSMTITQYIQMQSRFSGSRSTLRRKQVSLSKYLTPDRDLSAHLTLDVIPNGLQFRIVTSRDLHRFWLARSYATMARTKAN